MLLPRPISIAGADTSSGEVSLIYAVVGDGTRILSALRPVAVIDPAMDTASASVTDASTASIIDTASASVTGTASDIVAAIASPAATGTATTLEAGATPVQVPPAGVIEAMGPLGTGFFDYSGSLLRPRGLSARGRVLLIGGGVGIPPLLFAAQKLRAVCGDDIEIAAFLGYRGTPWLLERFAPVCDAVFRISEQPPAVSYESNLTPQTAAIPPTGNVVDLLGALRDEILTPAQTASKNHTLALSCGPKPMLAAVASWCAQSHIDLRVSLEERMGCGYGACAGCTAKTRPLNDPEKPQNGPNNAGEDGVIKKKVCVHGPVFWADEVVWS
jgi:dihydroorotate dehydrogenase electron transfer subunit